MIRVSHEIKKKSRWHWRALSLCITLTRDDYVIYALYLLFFAYTIFPFSSLDRGAHHVIHYSNNCVVPPSSFCPPPHKKHYTEKERN